MAWREMACATLLLAVACGGRDVRNRSGAATGTAGDTNVGGSSSATAGSAQQVEAGEPSVAIGGAGVGGTGVAVGGAADRLSVCDPDARYRAPGIRDFDRDDPGSAACQGQSLDDVIARAQALVPQLKAVNQLYVPDPNRGDHGSFIYAFQLDNGGFALAFQLGSGDCPSGCIDHEYWYFVTTDTCEVLQVGHYRPISAACPVGEGPMWAIPTVPPLSGVPCDKVTSLANMQGDYELVACGEEQPCAAAGKSLPVRALPGTVRISIEQSRNLAVGTVTLHGTGEPLLDERAFDATFSGRSLAVSLDGPLSPACAQNYSLSFHYDFDGVGPRSLLLDFERLNTCSGNAGASCKGRVRSEFGPAHLLAQP